MGEQIHHFWPAVETKTQPVIFVPFFGSVKRQTDESYPGMTTPISPCKTRLKKKNHPSGIPEVQRLFLVEYG